jgi:L-arabinokinase
VLLEDPVDDRALCDMGQLMAAAHDSYTGCGLGSPATDLLVKLAQEAGPANGIYGAKITGGGSGGVVAIIGNSSAEAAVATIARRYTELTKHESYIFRGSSPGAYGTQVREIAI